MNYLKIITLTVAITGMWALSFACINPSDQWAAGIVWNNNEQVDLSIIDSIGEAGVNFLKQEDSVTGLVKYIYRSHYHSDAMVYLGYFPISYQGMLNIPRLAVVLDTNEDNSSFDFGKSVREELNWLADTSGIVNMTRLERQIAEDSLNAAGRGDAQYWSFQKKVLYYNTWFIRDTVNGVWSLEAMDGVRGCGLDVAFQLPPKELDAPVSIKPAFIHNLQFQRLMIYPNPFTSMVKIQLPQNNSHGILNIFDLKGKLLRSMTVSKSVPAYWNGADLNGNMLANGWYIVKLKTENRLFQNRVLMIR
ncbi:MAG: T9SS type A sorting domain-containing protein [bacterium]